MLIAFLGLVHKVYPCGILSGIIISTTKVGEFLSAMNRSHISQKIVIPVAVMLRYVPTIREDWHFIKDAMRMRDVSPNLKNFILHPAMTIECIYVPLMMAASKTADELTVASVTRGIENPTQRHTKDFVCKDWLWHSRPHSCPCLPCHVSCGAILWGGVLND